MRSRDMLDVSRIIPLTRSRPISDTAKRRIGEDVRELRSWMNRNRREPVYGAGGPHEDALAIRLHAYRCMLSAADGSTPPANPLVNATVAPVRRRIETIAVDPFAKVVEHGEYDQTAGWA